MQFGNFLTAGDNEGLTVGSSTILAAYFTGGPVSAILTGVSVYGQGAEDCSMQFGVYDGSGNLLANSSHDNAVSGDGVPRWYTDSTITGTLNDPNGNYYICYIMNAATFDFDPYGYTAGGNLNRVTAQTYGSWPASPTFDNFGGFNPYQVSINLTYVLPVGSGVNFNTTNLITV